MGAEKVEKRIGLLKMNLRKVTDEAMDKTNARISPTWKTVQKQVERQTLTFLRKTERRGRRLLKKTIRSTIQELEKLDRKL